MLNPTTFSIKKKQLLLIQFLMVPLFIFAQQITTNNTVSVQDMIQNNLVSGCVEVSNISSSINGNVDGITSFGLFDKAGSSFPFNSGIVLTTGNIMEAGNTPNAAILQSGTSSWGTDPDLDAALGANNFLNATSVQFDFISATNSLEFNYIFASEEYFDTNPCNFSDGFVFLIKETGSAAPFTNIAVIEGTNTPVSTTTIHDEIPGAGGCLEENNAYFAGTDTSTNYNGRTTVLTASTTITANVSYTIKLVIADSRFEDFDSAVFIEANSFDNSVDLGNNISTCDATTTLNATVSNPAATYEWLINGNTFNGNDTPIITVDQDGIYTVEVSIPLNGSTCTFSDNVAVSLNASISLNDPLADLELCDDASNDGLENFNLTNAEAAMLALLPQPETYMFTYHETLPDAQSGNNPLGNTTNFSNATQTIIFIRALNSVGCATTTFFNLVVNPFPVITNPTNFFACTASGGAQLDELDDSITGGNTDLVVTYHTNPADAAIGANPITLPYIPTSNPENVFIHIEDSNSGCSTTSVVEVTVSANPTLNLNLQQIDACETDGDGFEAFDITSVESDILNGLTGVTVTYHQSLDDANTGAIPIPDPTNHTNTIIEEQTVYIRVVDNRTGCASIHPIELHTQLLHSGTDFIVTPENPVIVSACDDDGDGSVDFDLSAVAGGLLNDVQNATAQLFLNDPVANPSEPAIDLSLPFTITTSTPEVNRTLFATLNRTGPSCEYNNQILLVINPGVRINSPLTPQDYCDTDDDLTSVTVTDFSVFDTYLQTETTNADGTPAVTGFTYFLTQLQAETNDPADILGNNFVFTNPSIPQSVFFRATNTEGCFAIGELQINFLAAPTALATTNLFICSTDGSDRAEIDLTEASPGFNSATNLLFTFHESLPAAEANTGSIPDPTAYEILNTQQIQNIFVRVQNATTGCFSIQDFSVTINNKPNPTIDPYLVCLPIGQTVGDFFFETDIDPIILASGLNTAVNISYYENYNSTTDVLSNPIDKSIAFNNSSLVETIFVLIEYVNDTNCSTITSFQITVGELPDYNASITTFFACDDDSNDGSADFNLNEYSAQLAQGSSQSLTITYYTNQTDAENQQNPITNIDAFNNGNVNPLTIFYNIDNGTVCKAVESFELQVVPIPNNIVLPQPLVLCDTNLNNTDGFMPFNLTNIEAGIIAGITPRERPNIAFEYFPSQLDNDNNTNEITNPSNYVNISNSQTVIARIINTRSNCFNTTELTLTVDVPPVLASGLIYQFCDNDSNEFNFDDVTTDLIGTQTNVNLEFYDSAANADSQTGEIANPFNYTTNSTEIFVRANFNTSSCFNIDSFILNVNNRPSLTPLNDLTKCDDTTFDLIEPFDLNVQTAAALGSQNPANFSISYHTSLTDAESNTDALTNLNVLSPNDTEYFIRIESIATGCISFTSFKTIVFRKPQLTLEDRALCLDNLPLNINVDTGVSTDQYLWNTGATTAAIDITRIGTYSVTITTRNGCTNSDSFSLVESEAATIEFTETVDFSAPNNSITVNVTGIGNYLFQLDGGAPQESNIFTSVSYGVHLVTVIDELGCNAITKEVIVFDIPLFFTPNNDDFNDTWHITGVKELEGTIIYIFDRYGKLLKTLTHTSPGWNGFYNGYRMPTNDYWYLAKIKQGVKEFELTGHFTLKN